MPDSCMFDQFEECCYNCPNCSRNTANQIKIDEDYAYDKYVDDMVDDMMEER